MTAVMENNEVGVAELKARLSHYLHLAASGVPVMVTERGTPLVRLVSPQPADSLRVRPARGRIADLPTPPRSDLGVDIVEFLMEDRRSGR